MQYDDNDYKTNYKDDDEEADEDKMQQLSMNELQTEEKPTIPIDPTFYSNSYWKLTDDQNLDALLQDYN